MAEKSIVANIKRRGPHEKKFSAFSWSFHGPNDSINCCQHSCKDLILLNETIGCLAFALNLLSWCSFDFYLLIAPKKVENWTLLKKNKHFLHLILLTVCLRILKKVKAVDNIGILTILQHTL